MLGTDSKATMVNMSAEHPSFSEMINILAKFGSNGNEAICRERNSNYIHVCMES